MNKAREQMKTVSTLLALLSLNCLVRYLMTPSVSDMSPYGLILYPEMSDFFASLIKNKPWELFLPLSLGSIHNNIFWMTSTAVPFYLLSLLFSPLTVYILLSSFSILAGFYVSFKIFKSLFISFIFCLMMVLGLELNYIYSYGIIVSYYLFISYMFFNIFFIIKYLTQIKNCRYNAFGFFITLFLLAMGGPIWLNYLAVCLVNFIFLIFWSKHHQKFNVQKIFNLLAICLVVLIIFQLVTSPRSLTQFLKKGNEEELILNYHNWMLIIEDFIVNYFTYVFMTFTALLPSFSIFSYSLVHFGKEKIIFEQNGYHAQMTELVYFSHLFLWRFYAGVVTTLFLLKGLSWFKKTWNNPSDIKSLISFLLFLSINFGFSSYLLVKYRPYISTPMLTYKAAISIYFSYILIAYYLHGFYVTCKIKLQQIIFVFFLIVYFAINVITKPFTMHRAMEFTGVYGYRVHSHQILERIKHLF